MQQPPEGFEQQPGQSQYPQGHGMPPQQPGQPQYPQQGYPQQPYQQYQQPPQGYYPPQQQLPKKKNWVKRHPVVSILLGVVLLLSCGICGGISAATSSQKNITPSAVNTGNQSQSNSAPQSWQTTQNFSGNGSKKTAVFSVPDDWKIDWTCNPASFAVSSYNVIISVTNSDNTPADFGAVNSMCKASTTSGETEEHTSGNVFLDINSEGDWTAKVQELK